MWKRFKERKAFGEVKGQKLSREIGENERKIMLKHYIGNHDSQWNERCWEVSSTNSLQMELSRSYQEVSIAKWPQWIEKRSSNYRAYKIFFDGSKSYQEANETTSKKLQWIKIAITAVKKGRSRGSIDGLPVERCQEVVKIAQKQFFKEEKNTDMNAIMQLNQWSNQHFRLKNIFQQ